MAELRIGRGWSEAELEERLDRSKLLRRSFSDPPDQMTVDHGWNKYYSEAVVAREPSGPPQVNAAFERGWIVVANYEFSDPEIVIGHFDPHAPLLGRYMLLEVRALRVLHYLSSVVVGDVRSEQNDDRTVYGFRYDTLEGHIERGFEWFLLTKDHATGEIRFRVEAAWRPGDFPNWWSRLGFSLIAPHYQKAWHHHAHARLARLIHDRTLKPPEPEEGLLVHTGPEVEFKRFQARHVRQL